MKRYEGIRIGTLNRKLAEWLCEGHSLEDIRFSIKPSFFDFLKYDWEFVIYPTHCKGDSIYATVIAPERIFRNGIKVQLDTSWDAIEDILVLDGIFLSRNINENFKKHGLFFPEVIGHIRKRMET